MNSFKTNKFKKGDKVTSVDNYELGVFEVQLTPQAGTVVIKKVFKVILVTPLQGWNHLLELNTKHNAVGFQKVSLKLLK